MNVFTFDKQHSVLAYNKNVIMDISDVNEINNIDEEEDPDYIDFQIIERGKKILFVNSYLGKSYILDRNGKILHKIDGDVTEIKEYFQNAFEIYTLFTLTNIEGKIVKNKLLVNEELFSLPSGEINFIPIDRSIKWKIYLRCVLGTELESVSYDLLGVIAKYIV